MEDVEPFIEWLRSRGTPAQHLDAYRYYAAELVKHPSLSAALLAHEEAGATAKQIANLRQTAARIIEFETAGSAATAAEVAPRNEPARDVSVPEVAPRKPVLDGPALEVEPRQPRATGSPQRHDAPPLRRGCACKKHYDIYLDNDFGSLATLLGGGIGIGTIVLVRFVGLLGAAALALALAGFGGLVTIVSICFRCEGCRRKVRDLNADERAHLRKGRALVVIVTLGLLAGATLCAFVWWSAVKSRRP